VIETHPHADFVSSHLEIHRSAGAVIYVSKLLGAEYEHQPFDDGDKLAVGNISLHAINTPGHSPDSICIVARDTDGKDVVVFTGDTLFIGDCGRPDLRKEAGAITADATQLARQMYHSLRDRILKLPDSVLIYPAHGAGSLCGRAMSSNNSSTLGIEKATNWSLQEMDESDFVRSLLENQPFVPKYFPYDVELNKKGAPDYKDSTGKVKISEAAPDLTDFLIIDTRDASEFNKGHFRNSVNLMDDVKFETWLGSIIAPGEKFYLVAGNKAKLSVLTGRIARIGYEGQIEEAFVAGDARGEEAELLDLDRFRKFPENFTILDIRNPSEVKDKKIFDGALEIPLYELRERAGEVPLDKPVVVHCAGGYRSAAGASILKNLAPENAGIFDLGNAIKTF
jgi:rhodanese-related sulfurtransferase